MINLEQTSIVSLSSQKVLLRTNNIHSEISIGDLIVEEQFVEAENSLPLTGWWGSKEVIDISEDIAIDNGMKVLTLFVQ